MSKEEIVTPAQRIAFSLVVELLNPMEEAIRAETLDNTSIHEGLKEPSSLAIVRSGEAKLSGVTEYPDVKERSYLLKSGISPDG